MQRLTAGPVLLGFFMVSLAAACASDDETLEQQATRIERSVPQTALQRLSRRELLTTIFDLTGIDVRKDLPTFDTRSIVETSPTDFYFDNAPEAQTPSGAYVSRELELADLVGAKFATALTTANASPLNASVYSLACAVLETRDVPCLEEFVRGFGRRALRRPLEEDEVNKLITVGASAVQGFGKLPSGTAPSFALAIAAVTSALLAHPETSLRPRKSS
jgi:hypothetical protein